MNAGSRNSPRRAFERGPDPQDPSFSITVLLPDVALCATHAQEVSAKTTSIGWCDNELCRMYGEVGQVSPCGQAFVKAAPQKAATK